MSSIKGHFDGAAVVLDEPASLAVGQQVRIVIDSPDANEAQATARKSLAGFAKGMFEMRDDFNELLDEFAEYR
jgi:hypothetical protein